MEYIEIAQELLPIIEEAQKDPLNETLSNENVLYLSKKPSASTFFEDKTFIPKRLADYLMVNYQFKYAAETLWVYQNGVYSPRAEAFVAHEAQKALDEAARSNRIQEAVEYIKRATMTDFPEPNLKFINVKNGRLDWQKLKLHPHQIRYFDTVQLPVLYDPEASCPNFEKYLETTFDADVIPLVKEIMGYCLIPSTKFEKAVMLTGSGSNGKSVFLDVIQYLLGEDNISNVDLQSLEENKFMAAELLGKLANIYADLSAQAMKTSRMFKTLVTGDRISAERKFGQPFQFNNHAKLIFSANELPRNNDRTYAYYRRWLIIPFTRTFDKDTADRSLRDKLKKEVSGIFNYALEGLQQLHQNGAFSEPEQIKQALTEYQIHNDSVAAFVADCVEEDPNSSVQKQKLYDIYRRWCSAQGIIKPAGQRTVKDTLYRIFPAIDEYRDGNFGPWCWVGVNLTEDTYSFDSDF